MPPYLSGQKSASPPSDEVLKDIVAVSNFGDRLQCNTTVEALTWDEESATWEITIRRNDGSTGHVRANVVIAATGLLRMPPKMPEVDGIEDCKGISFLGCSHRRRRAREEFAAY